MLTKTALEFLTCKALGEGADARSFLEIDTTVVCDGASYTSWALGLGIPMLVLYATGIVRARHCLSKAQALQSLLRTCACVLHDVRNNGLVVFFTALLRF